VELLKKVKNYTLKREHQIEDKMRIIMEHLLETQVPFSKSQMSRLYYAAKGIPDPKGNVYDIEKELPGIIGLEIN